MDFNSLTAAKTNAGSIASWINYALIPAADIVLDAENEIFGRMRVREMRKALAFDLAVGDASAPLPAGYLDSDTLTLTIGGRIKRISDDRLLNRRAYDQTNALIQGLPSTYGVFDEAFQFDVAAQQACSVRGMYYAGPHLSAQATTSFLTNRYSALFRAVLLQHAYAYRKEWDAASKYAAKAEALFAQTEQNDDLSYRGIDDDDLADSRP